MLSLRLTIIALLFLPTLSSADAPVSVNNNVTLQLSNTDLRSVIELILKNQKKNCILAGECNFVSVPAISIKDVPLEIALRSILKTAGLKLIVTNEDYIIVPDPKNLKPVDDPTVGKDESAPINLYGKGRYVVKQNLGKPKGISFDKTPASEKWYYDDKVVVFEDCMVVRIEPADETRKVKMALTTGPQKIQKTPNKGRYVGIYGYDPNLGRNSYDPSNPPIQFGQNGLWKVMTQEVWIARVVSSVLW